MNRFIIVNDPESKQSSKEWKRADLLPSLTKPKQEKLVGKVLYSFFLGSQRNNSKRIYTERYNNNKDILYRYFGE